MQIIDFFLGFILYTTFEAIFRITILVYFAGTQYATWKLVSPHLVMLFSPGYWLAMNCKRNSSSKPRCNTDLRACLITNYNFWNLLFSCLLLVAVTTIQREGFSLFNITKAFIAWRFISRSIEITLAFGCDITTPFSASKLSNTARIKLAFTSYLEIFLFSAAYYSASSSELEGFRCSLLASLYVGTFTNVSCVAGKLPIPHLAFLQVFATLSLVLLSIAGYLGKVKRGKRVFVPSHRLWKRYINQKIDLTEKTTDHLPNC